MVRAIFLDRDGVLNQKAPEGWYIAHVEQFELLPGALDALAKLYKHGFRLFVVTNQRGITSGMVSLETLDRIHQRLLREVATAGGRIEEVYVCSHDYSDQCDCRKPRPGMLLQAAMDHDIDLNSSWMIGDSASDIEAGRNAGCKTAYIGPGYCESADLSAPSLAEVVRSLLAR